MLIIVTYDVHTKTDAGKRRLLKISKICKNYGQRVQNSVFECDVTGPEYINLKTKLIENINEKEDTLRIYNLGSKYQNKIEHYGIKESYDPEGELIL